MLRLAGKLDHRMSLQELTITAADSTPLHVRIWQPRLRQAYEKNLIIVHGACEHGGRYEKIAEVATSQGWTVISPDHRGHGLSGGIRVHVNDFQQYVNDLDLILSDLKIQRHRTVMLGHSMGGLLASRYVQTTQPRCSALALSAPLFAVSQPIPFWKLWLGKLLEKSYPTARFKSTISPDELSHDENYLHLRAQDELIQKGVTARWFYAVQEAIQDVFADRSSVNLPCLMLLASEDRVVCNQSAERWVNSHTENEIQIETIENTYHEILNERDWKLPLEMILNFGDHALKLPEQSQFNDAQRAIG